MNLYGIVSVPSRNRHASTHIVYPVELAVNDLLTGAIQGPTSRPSGKNSAIDGDVTLKNPGECAFLLFRRSSKMLFQFFCYRPFDLQSQYLPMCE